MTADEKDRIIVVSGSKDFIPIIKRLASKGYKFMTVDQTFAKTLADLDLPSAPLSEAMAGVQDRAAYETIKILNAAQKPTSVQAPTTNVSEFMRNNAPIYLYSRIMDLNMVLLALDRVQPELIMVHNDVEPLLRCVALWARHNKVPCLHIPHAIYQDINRGGPGTDVHDIVTASHLAAAGPFQRDWYVKRGFPAKNIRETGLPQHDECTKQIPQRGEARRLLKLDSHRPVVVYVATWPQATNLMGINDEWAVCYLTFLQAIRQLPGVQVIVKLHPRAGQDNFNWHKQKADEANIDYQITAIHNQHILQVADLVFAYGGSNFLLEAASVPGVRLVTTHGYEDDNEVLKIPIDLEMMQRLIQVALSMPAPDMLPFRLKYIGIPDGRASERIADFAEELTNAKGKIQRHPVTGRGSKTVSSELSKVPG